MSSGTCSATGTMFLLFGQHDHAVGDARVDRLEDLRGRRVHRLPARDHLLHAEAAQERAETVAHRDRDDPGGDARRARARRRRRPPSRTQASSSRSATCSRRSVTRMSRGRPDRDAGLDRGADVVGVHVAVPEAVAADDDDRVAEVAPRGLEAVDAVVGRLEEVHHLVAEVGDAASPPRRSPSPACAPTAMLRVHLLGRGQRAVGHHVEARGEQQLEPATAGVDDAGLPQHRQQVGGARPPRRAPRRRPARTRRRGWSRPRSPRARPTRRRTAPP